MLLRKNVFIMKKIITQFGIRGIKYTLYNILFFISLDLFIFWENSHELIKFKKIDGLI